MFIARLYLDRAIALPSDSLNEPAIQPTDTISGPANFPSRCVFLSLVPRILRAYTDPHAPSSRDLRPELHRVGHRHPLENPDL